MTIATAPRTSANAVTEGTAKIEVDNTLFHVGEPTAYTLIALTGGEIYKDGSATPQKVPGKIKKQLTSEVEYKVIEKSPKAREITVNGAVASTSTESITVDSQTVLTVGTVLENKATGEIMYVHTVTSATAIVCRRNLGSTTFQIADNAVLRIVGYAATEGGPKRSIRSQLAAARARKTQIFKTSFGVTGTAQAIKYEVNPNGWQEEQTQAAVDHNKDREFSFWFNAAVDSTTDVDGNTVTLTRGILAEIRGDHDDVDVSSSFTEDDFFGEVAAKIFEYGPQRKAYLCDSTQRSIINGFARSKLLMKSTETMYGFTAQEIDTGHGILEILPTSVFTANMDTGTNGFGVALDLERVKYRFLEGRDSFLQNNIETAGTDAKEAQFITECGLSLLCLPHHVIVAG